MAANKSPNLSQIKLEQYARQFSNDRGQQSKAGID